MKSTALLLALLVLAPAWGQGIDLSSASGRELLDAVHARHRAYPYIYEEQSMTLTDRHGQRESRRMRSYMRIEEDGGVKFMLVFDSPSDVRGVAVMALRDAAGDTRNWFYLPAYGDGLIEATGSSMGESFLGTDFSVEDLAGEAPDGFVYVRQRDRRINGVDHYIVDGAREGSERPELRHFILADNLFIVRTDHLDQFGRLRKRQTYHDIRPVGGGVWRSNIVRMDDFRSRNQSLIRVERRVFSRDYVPERVFTLVWLMANQEPLVAEEGQ